MRSLHRLGLTTITALFSLISCATAQEQPGFGSAGGADGEAGSSSAAAGSSGSPGTGGGMAQAGQSGSGNSAFGGTSSVPAGGSASGGTAGSGNGGASAGAGGSAKGGSSAAGTGGGSAGGATSGCLIGWQMSNCDTCSTQTQPDHQACSVVLKCYEDNSCTPTTCGQPDQKCGQNTLGMGTAPFPIALDVYNCRCP